LFLSGLGGGFKENENVEYVYRGDSDGEYDEVWSNLSCTVPTEVIILNVSFCLVWKKKEEVSSPGSYSNSL
jgi:hypothetical protein